MRTFRALAVVTTAAGLLTGLPLSHALACDNDRFPCPIVSDTPETTEAPAKATPTTPARSKKAAPRQDERAAAHQDEKTRPKTERDATRAPSRAKAAKPEVQEQPVDSAAAMPAPVMQPPAAEAERKDNPAPAVAAWPPAPAGAGTSMPVAAERAPAPALAAGVATVDPNEVNELDLAAAAPAPTPAESSWIKYLLATLGAALAAASTVRFLFV